MQQHFETRQQPLKKYFEITYHNLAFMCVLDITKELL